MDMTKRPDLEEEDGFPTYHDNKRHYRLMERQTMSLCLGLGMLWLDNENVTVK